MVKIAIIGSRTFNNYELVKREMEHYKESVSLIVSGGAKGADSLAERWASENGIMTKIFLPDWEKHGRAAGFLRNKDIVKEADVVLAFWDGQSKGTQHSFKLAQEMNKQIKIIKYSNPL